MCRENFLMTEEWLANDKQSYETNRGELDLLYGGIIDKLQSKQIDLVDNQEYFAWCGEFSYADRPCEPSYCTKGADPTTDATVRSWFISADGA